MTERPLEELKYIVIHHSVTSQSATKEDIKQMHLAKGYSDIGYHYLVYPSGFQVGRELKYRGAHAITEKDPYEAAGIDMNRAGIGICVVGNFEHDEPAPPITNELAYLVKLLAKKYNIKLDRSHIIPHSSVSYTACPGKVMKALYRKIAI